MKKIAMMIAALILLGSNGYAEPDYEKLADAIFHAEGGRKASVPYGIFFKGCSWESPEYCRKICLNTLRNKHRSWVLEGFRSDYLSFLASKYAPLEDSGLNRFWLRNVRWFLDNPREVHYAR